MYLIGTVVANLRLRSRRRCSRGYRCWSCQSRWSTSRATLSVVPLCDTSEMSGEPMSISVAMTTFQGARYLQRQLHSILEQSRRPEEIVIFDDVSSDATWQILTEFARNTLVPVRLHR